MDCTAKIFLYHLINYPSFQLEKDSKRNRKVTAQTLKNAFEQNIKDIGVHSYIIKFPKLSDHKNHATSGEFSICFLPYQLANLREKVDPRVKNKIVELYRSGVRKASEVKRHTDAYVRCELFPSGDLPEASRRRFYPTQKDISNLMCKDRYEGKNSVLDQQNVIDLVNNWKEEKTVNIFYRPHTNKVNGDFLYCYQTEWQQRLLQKYGKEVTLLDATYRTTRYALPLFFLCVRTNVCYAVVGAFIVQQETAVHIEEALQMFKTWNKKWNANHFMVDFCLEEINAVTKVFKDTKIILCDFHREKAWSEWLNKKVHGVQNVKKILQMIRNVAKATTMESHNEALLTLKKSQDWKKNETFRKWFSMKWMPEIKKWAHVYRNSSLHVRINTNNGLERQNEILKHNCLDGYKNCTLSEMINVLHCKFFPMLYKKYIQLNVQSSEHYRRYSKDIPSFLKSRPRDFVLHVMKRYCTALNKKDVTTVDDKDGIFKVKSESGDAEYLIHLNGPVPSCTCEDFTHFLLPCKHICCIFQHFSNWGWDRLNPSYTNNPLFVLDSECFSENLQIIEANSEDANIQDASSSTVQLSGEKLEYLPPRRKMKRTILVRHCAQGIKNLLDCIYLVKDEGYLVDLEKKIKEMVEEVSLHIPRDRGLPVLETPPKKARIEDLNPLPSRKYGKPKQLGFQRFGSKAEQQKMDVWKSVEVENIDMSVAPHTAENPNDTWVTINKIKLSNKDKDDISTDKWIDDNSINSSLHLISQNYPCIAGLIDTLILATSAVDGLSDDNVIQIHHLGNHWLVSQSNGKWVTIYDSLRFTGFPEILKTQILKLYAPLFVGENQILEVFFKCTQKQHGPNDCGLFAVANAVALAEGVELANIEFCQEEMRAHLIKCFESGHMAMFPHRPRRAKVLIKKIEMTKFCRCHMYRPKQNMIECSKCKMWFHFLCVNMQKDDKCVTTNRKFYCDNCQQ
ncbi:hypothetical protein XELAEV_18028457mg [Xenopus laevis]|uniref:SWIM-type domain-containing protein n=1 Tax=Xenopus laevis TaxID=8355 RepID=A0A974HKR3_XENLA|nr:hypothetical protein XELAEV_18028457mg [Xenopus laevis]